MLTLILIEKKRKLKRKPRPKLMVDVVETVNLEKKSNNFFSI